MLPAICIYIEIHIYSKTLTSDVKRTTILWKKGNPKQLAKSHAPI